MRLSGFKTIENEIPRALTVDYTKREDALPRYLIIGATIKGKAVAMLLTNPNELFVAAYENLEKFQHSNICKHLPIQEEVSILPFTSTQVHGYTLEHALGIIPIIQQFRLGTN